MPKRLQSFLLSKKVLGFLVLYTFYKIIFNSFTADFVVPRVFSKVSNGTFSGEFHSFSLFYGLEISNIRIHSGKDFGEEILFQADRLHLKYNLPYLLFLKVRVSDILLENAKVFLKEKDGKWNVATLFPPGEKQEEPEPEEDPEKESSNEIPLYVPIQATLHLAIRDLSVFLSKENQDKVELEKFNFNIDLETNRFRSVILGPSILEEINSLQIGLNPQEPLSLLVQTKELSFQDLVPFHVGIHWTLGEKTPDLHTKIAIGSESWRAIYKNREYTPAFRFLLNADMNPETEEISVSELSLSLLRDRWLFFQGKATGFMGAEPSVAFSVSESWIDLGKVQRELGPLLKEFGVPVLGGTASIQGTGIQSQKNRIEAQVLLSASGLSAGLPTKSWAIPKTSLDLRLVVDPKVTEGPSTKDPFPLLQSLELRELFLNPNGIVIEGKGQYQRLTEVFFDFQISQLVLSDFSPMVSGRTKLQATVEGSSLEFLQAKVQIALDGFRYKIERSLSPPSSLEIGIDPKISFGKPLVPSNISWNQLTLRQKDKEGKKSLDLSIAGKLALSESTKISVNSLQAQIWFEPLLRTLPLLLKEKMQSLPGVLGNELRTQAKVDLEIASDKKSILGEIGLQIPGLELPDFKMVFDIGILSKPTMAINIRKLQATAFQNVFSLMVKGKLEEKKSEATPPLGPFFGNLDVSLSLQSSQLKYLTKGISFQGNFGLGLKIQDYLISGSLDSKNSVAKVTSGKCPSEDCKVFVLDQIQASIPIEHNLAWKRSESLIVADKSIFIRNRGRASPPNFTIGEVIGTHPNIPNLPFEYIKRQKDSPGFAARIEYKENFASIESLKAHTLNGQILGSDMLFNLGSANPKTMEFRGSVQVRDIDLKQLMAPKVRDKIDDGKLKADLNIEVRDFTDPVANLDVFFSIFQIGKDFGKSALNVISPQNFLMDRITDSYSIQKIEVSLSKGLVYADVFFRRSLLSLIVNLEDSKISQQRMPLASFLKRAQSEIESYQ